MVWWFDDDLPFPWKLLLGWSSNISAQCRFSSEEPNGGAYVEMVLEGSPAAEAKIKENDQILEVGALPFRSVLILIWYDLNINRSQGQSRIISHPHPWLHILHIEKKIRTVGMPHFRCVIPCIYHWTAGQWPKTSSFRASTDSHPLNESGWPGETEDPTWQRVDLYNSNFTQPNMCYDWYTHSIHICWGHSLSDLDNISYLVVFNQHNQLVWGFN